MAKNQSCIALTPDIVNQLPKLAEEFMGLQTRKKKAVGMVVLLLGNKAASTAQVKSALIKYFKLVLERYCYDGKTVTIPDMNKLQEYMEKDYDAEVKQAQEEERLKQAALISELNEETLDTRIKVDNQQTRSEIEGYVINELRRRVNKLGLDWGAKYSNIANVFKRGGSKNFVYECSVDDLFCMIYAACSLDAEGNPILSAGNLRKAINGDKVILNDIRNYVETMQVKTTGAIRALEKHAMELAVEVWLGNNPEMIGKLSEVKQKIKAGISTSRKHKALSLVLDAVKDRTRNESFDITADMTCDPGSKMQFRPDNDRVLLNSAEDILNKTVKKRGIFKKSEGNKREDAFAGIADWIEENLGERALGSPLGFVGLLNELLRCYESGNLIIGRTYGGTGDKIKSIKIQDYNSDRLLPLQDLLTDWNYSNPTEKDDSGEFKAGLLRDDAVALLYECYKQAFKEGSASAVKLREYLTAFKGKELNTNFHNTLSDNPLPFADEIIEVLNHLRDVWAGESQEFDLMQAAEHIANIYAVDEDADEMAKRNTNHLVTIFGTKRLKDRVDAISAAVIKTAKDKRFSWVNMQRKQIKENTDAINDEFREIRDIKRDKQDDELTERELADIKERRDHIKRLRKTNRDLERSISLLLDKSTAFRESMRLLVRHNALKNGVRRAFIDAIEKTTEQGSEEEKAAAKEYNLVLQNWDQIACLAFAKIEAMTGVHIVMQIDEEGSHFEVKETTEDQEKDPNAENDPNAETTEGDVNVDGEEGENDTSTNSMVYGEDVDPFAHLSQNVRAFLSMIEMRDSKGKPMVDDMGMPMYHDPKTIYMTILSICDSEVDIPEDFYIIDKNEDLDDTDRIYPPALNEKGKPVGPNRTAKEAFPYGKPRFPLLDKYEHRYPWISELKQRLTDDFMEESAISRNNNIANIGACMTDLYCELGHTFTKRVMMKNNGMIDTNTLVEVDSNRAAQRRNYENRIMLGTSPIYNSSGTVNVENCKSLLKLVNGIPDLNELRSGVSKKSALKKAVKDIETILRNMGFDVVEGLVYEELSIAGNLPGYTRVANIVTAAKNLLNGLVATYKSESDPDNNIYYDQWSRWQYMWNAAGFFLDSDTATTSSREAGKTRYNWLQPNELSKTLNLLTLGHKAARYVHNEKQRNELLKKRRERIDKLFGDCPDFVDPDTGEYTNHILRQVYNGEDIPSRAQDNIVRAGLRIVADSVQMTLKDDIEYGNMSAEDQWVIQYAGYMRGEQASNGGSRLFMFPVMADAPVVQFISGKSTTAIRGGVDPIFEATREMTHYTLIDLHRIQRHKRQKVMYTAVQAWHNGWVSGGKYYDIVENEDKADIPTGDTYEARVWAKIEQCYKMMYGVSKDGDAKKTKALRDRARKKLEALLDPGETVEGIQQDYMRYQQTRPRGTYFTYETQFGWIRSLNQTRMTMSQIIDRLNRYELANETAKPNDYGTQFYGALTELAGNRKFTFEGALDFIRANQDKLTSPDTETLHDDLKKKDDEFNISFVFTQQALEDLYKAETQSLVEPAHLHRELEHFHCIEMALRQQPDYNGRMWEIEEVPTLTEKPAYKLVNKETGRITDLSEKESAYADSRIQAMRLWVVSNPMSAEDFFRNRGYAANTYSGEGRKYSFDTIVNFRPRWKNHDELMSVTRNMSHNSKAKISEEMVYHRCKEMWFDTFAHNSAMLQILGMDPSQFKSDEEFTKRLKMLYSNGLRADTNRVIGHKEERYIIASDDELAISAKYADNVMAFVNQGMNSKQALEKCWAYANINATNAQGLLHLDAYREKASMYGTSYWNATHERLYWDLKQGKRTWSDRSVRTAFQTLKQIGMGMDIDPDLDGIKEAMSQGIKNSEAVMMTRQGMPRSATMIALDEFTSETPLKRSYIDENGNQQIETVKIHSIQRPSGVKTARKGIVDIRFIPERVQAFREMCISVKSTKDPAEQEKIFTKFAKKWKSEFLEIETVEVNGGNRKTKKVTLTPTLVRQMFSLVDTAISDSRKADAGGLANADHLIISDMSKLSFDRIDALLHARLKHVTQQVLDKQIDENTFRVEVNRIISLRNLLMPVKSTQKTIDSLKNQIRKCVMDENGFMNEQYVNTIDCRSQAMQLRVSNHDKNTLGSQQAYLTPTGIKPHLQYYVKINGVKSEKIQGNELYKKFHECLAARLLAGVMRVNKRIHNLYDLRRWLIDISENNPKHQDILQGLAIIDRALGDETVRTFATPISSVATIYRLSEILTSLARNNTHRKPVKGRADVLEADTMYDDNLSLEYDENGNVIGVQCYIAEDCDILKGCIVKKKRRLANGREVEVEEIDINKLKKAGLDRILGYRIPTEELHSMLPLIVKGTIPATRGASIVVAKEITTLTGSDNDVDKLFVMLKNIEWFVDKKGNRTIRAVQYDWDKPMVEQSEGAIENMMIDITNAVLTHPSNVTRWLSPQNPDTYVQVGNEIAYSKLPADKKLRQVVHPGGIDFNGKHYDDGEFVYLPDYEHWDETDFSHNQQHKGENYFVVVYSPDNIKPDVLKKHMALMHTNPVQSIGSRAYFHKQHSLAKTGVAVGADNMAGYSKIRSGIDNLARNFERPESVKISIKYDGVPNLSAGISINGVAINEYCPETDTRGGSVMENCSDFSAAMVDSGKSSAISDIGITLENAGFAGFLLSRFGVDPNTMAYIMAILEKNPNFVRRFRSILRNIIDDENANLVTGTTELGDTSTEALKKAFNTFDLLNKDTLYNNRDLLNACKVIDFLYSTYNNSALRQYESSLKFNSAKHGMSNDFSSAVWAIMRVDRVEQLVDKDKLPIKIPPEMVVRTGLDPDEIPSGTIKLKDGTEVGIGLMQVQMYFTYGMEQCLDAMSDKIFYAHPAFLELVRSFQNVLERLPKEDGIKLIKQLHDEFSTYYISDMNIVTHRGGAAAINGFTDMRSYYRYKFPGEFRTMLSNADMKDKYAILRVLKYEDGRLIIDDELKNELKVTDIRNSLVQMAESDSQFEREMALDLFLYAYFSDGLRFSYGAVSNVFDVGFLSNSLFDEYNTKVELLCRDRGLAGKKLARFALQFVRNNYKKYNFGTTIYASKAAQKGEDGMWAVIEEPNAKPEDYEVTPQEIGRLEKWLEDRENNNKMYLEDKDRMVGESNTVRLKYPSKLSKILQEYDFKPGEFICIQASFSEREKSLYMINKDNNGLYLQKVVDTNGDKWYDLSKTILEMAEMDCWRNETGGIGKWPKVRTTRGATHDRIETSKAFMEGKISPRMEKANQDAAAKDEDPQEIAMSGVSDAVDDALDAAEEAMQNWKAGDGDIFDFDVMFGDNTPQLLDAFADVTLEDADKRKPFPKKSGDRTIRMSTNMFSELAQYQEGEQQSQDEEAEPKVPMFMVAFDQRRESAQQRKNAVLEQYGVRGVTYNDMGTAINDAATINQGQNEFVAVAKQKADGSYEIQLYISSNTDAANQWAEQYRAFMLTGPQGIDEQMVGFGDQSVKFVEAGADAAECDETIETLVDILEQTLNRTSAGQQIKLPPMSLNTARAIVRRLRKERGMVDLFEDLKKNATNDLLSRLFSTAVTTVDYQNATEDELVELAASLLSDLSQNVEKLMGIANDTNIDSNTKSKARYLANKIKARFPALISYACSHTSMNAANNLKKLKGLSVPGNTETVTDAEQRAAERTRIVFDNGIRKVESLKEIAEKALTMELRKERIYQEQQLSTVKGKERIDLLQRALRARNGVGPGMIMAYLYKVAEEYKDKHSFLNSLSNGSSDLDYSGRLEKLHEIRTIIKSHEELLEQLRGIIDNPEYREQFRTAYHHQFSSATAEEVTASLEQMYNEVKDLHNTMKSEFTKNAAPTIIGFFKEFIGNADELLYVNGKHITWEQLFTAYDGDISLIDMYLRSMGDTGDPIGMMVSRVVRSQKDRARQMAMDDQQGRIRELNQFILDNKLEDFEFMFEHDESGKKTGWYVSELNNGAFHKALDDEKEKLRKVLEDPNATKVQEDAARDAFKAWTSTYAKEVSVGTYEPLMVVHDNGTRTSPWLSKEWKNLTPTQLEFMKKFKDIKDEYDRRLGAHTASDRAIQRRMTSEQRFKANFTLSPKAFFENVKEKLANDFLVREDDYMEQNERSAVLDFDGTQRMVMPAPYVRMLKNPNELSTDPIGCLVAYSYATANFQMMKEIANPLETVFDALVDGRVQYDERTGRVTTESFRGGVKEKAKIAESRMLRKLRSFLDSQIYMRYLSDGDDTFKVWGKEFRKSKVINAFLHMSAVAQLGFNWLVDIANLSNGILQTNIEAMARRHFRGATLRKADFIYGKELTQFIPDLTRPIKESKLALMSEKFNFLQNFDVKVYNNRRNSIVAKFFNNQIAFLGTACGNHWLYSRVAIAKMLETEVVLRDGTKTNLWDAFTVETDPTTGKKFLKLAEGAKVNGEEVTEDWLNKFTDEVARVNRHLFGAYSREDMVMAQKTCMGKLLISFRKHIVPLMDKRWRKRHKNEFGEWEEGYMWTVIPFMKALKDAQFKIPAAWDSMDEEQKMYLRMAFTDIAQMAALWIVGLLLFAGGDDDDDDEAMLKKWCKFIITREKHEIGSMLPTLYMGKEAWNIIDQPVMGTQQLGDLYNFCDLAVHPWDYMDKVKSGPFAGKTNLEMRFRKLPFPPMTYIKNIDKTLNGVDNSTWYYGRGYVGR